LVIPNEPLASGTAQPVGFADAAAELFTGLLFEGAKQLGMNEESAAMAAVMVVIVNDLRGLRVNKVIDNVDDLLDAAGSFKHKGSGTKTLQGENTIEGNMNEVFETITDGFDSTSGGAKIHPDGRIIHQHNSKHGPTITVDQPGELQKKIRFKDE
jgi:hypothetical protein